jgi:hypothetical protein
VVDSAVSLDDGTVKLELADGRAVLVAEFIDGPRSSNHPSRPYTRDRRQRSLTPCLADDAEVVSRHEIREP